MEFASEFLQRVAAAPSLVWIVAMFMSIVAGYLLHSFVDDWVFAIVTSVAMFCAILVAQEAFMELGIFFTASRETNIAAAASVAVCAVTLIAIILLRIWNAFGEFTNRLRGKN